MDPGLYIAAQGMVAEQVLQDQLSNDLANSATPGYKPDAATQRSFGELLLSNTATGQPVGGIQTGVTAVDAGPDMIQGPLKHTGQPLDFAIAGAGFFAVRTAAGVRYTRDGQFSSSANGLLVDAQGNPVLSQNGAPIAVGAQGTVPASSLGVFNLTGPVKQGDNLYTGTVAGRGTGTVHQGEIEQSAVDPVYTMTDMISALRTYQTGQQAIQTIAQTLQDSSTSVGAIGGS